jgi:segregation and condensation protein B
MEERATLDQVESAIEAVREKYSSEFYPFEVRESGGGWQFLTKGTYHKTVAVLNGDKFLKRLSSAALETLAIIAYKQPITKGEIESIRGVNSDYAVQKLLEKELVVITGRKEDAPGHPLIYATSKTFMDYFGINSPDELPKLSDIVPTDMVMPTAIGEAHMVDSDVEAEQQEDATAPTENATDNSAEVNMLAVNADGEMEEIMLNAEATIDAAEAIEEVQEETIEIEAAEEAGNSDDAAADAAAPADDDEPTQA